MAAASSGSIGSSTRRGEEGVVGEELLVVVGGPAGDVELDEQVEGELEGWDPQFERDVGLDLANGGRSSTAWPSGTSSSRGLIGWRLWPPPIWGTG
jgi:hypothetical protein